MARNKNTQSKGERQHVSTPTSVVFANGTSCSLTSKQAAQISILLSEEELLTPEQASRLLSVSRPMVIRWIAEGLLPDFPAGTHHRIPKSAVIKLCDERRENGMRAIALIASAKTNPSAARKSALARAAAAQRVAKINN